MTDLSKTKDLLEKFQILPRQSLGQNFLVAESSIKKIIELSHLSSDDQVLEIGPGCGALTGPMLDLVDELTAYEIDSRLIGLLQERFSDHENFRLHQADILQVNLHKEMVGRNALKLVANLPYYISSACIEKVICELPYIKSLSLMLQKEAADRLTLKENQSRYGVTAILLRLFGRVEGSFKLGPNSFYPRPKVQSQVLFIQADPNSYFKKRLAQDPDFQVDDFRKFLVNAFAMRRKTLVNNLKAAYPDLQPDLFTYILAELGIQDRQRPEEIAPEKFWQLFDSVAEYVSNY